MLFIRLHFARRFLNQNWMFFCSSFGNFFLQKLKERLGVLLQARLSFPTLPECMITEGHCTTVRLDHVLPGTLSRIIPETLESKNGSITDTENV